MGSEFLSIILVTLLIFYENKMLSPDGFQLIRSCFCRDLVFICLLLPENVIIFDKCLSKCGKRATMNLRFVSHVVFLLHLIINKN